MVGYENRKLNKEDFNDDKKDAGELGAGHSVTALYEIIPAGSSERVGHVDPLKYQKSKKEISSDNLEELLTVKFRYKEPKGSVSKLIVHTLDAKPANKPSKSFNFSSAVAQYGMILRDSRYKGEANYANTILLAQKGLDEDPSGYKNEFLRLVKNSELLDVEKRD